MKLNTEMIKNYSLEFEKLNYKRELKTVLDEWKSQGLSLEIENVALQEDFLHNFSKFDGFTFEDFLGFVLSIDSEIEIC